MNEQTCSPTENPAPVNDWVQTISSVTPAVEDTPMAHMIRRLKELVDMREGLRGTGDYGYSQSRADSPSGPHLDAAIKAVSEVVAQMAKDKVRP